MSSVPVHFRELMSPAVDNSIKFYENLFGWKALKHKADIPGGEYVLLTANGKGHGGIYPWTKEQGKSFWMPYFLTPDIDGVVAKVTPNKGTMKMDTVKDLGPAGKMAVCFDPQGAIFGLWQNAKPETAQKAKNDECIKTSQKEEYTESSSRKRKEECADSSSGKKECADSGKKKDECAADKEKKEEAAAAGDPNELPKYSDVWAWEQLITNDAAGAMQFYSTIMKNWIAKKEIGIDMFRLDDTEKAFCGVAKGPTTDTEKNPPIWLSYVDVPSVDDFCVKLKDLGGKVTNGPFDVPLVGRVAVVTDPHGAMFCLFTAASKIKSADKDKAKAADETSTKQKAQAESAAVEQATSKKQKTTL